MNEIIRKKIYDVLSLVNVIVPKKNRILINGGEFLLDNSEAMLDYLDKNYDKEIICIAEKRRMHKEYGHVDFRPNTVFENIKCLLSSKVVLESSLQPIKVKPFRQIIIQMWHGSPLKKLEPTGTIKNGKYYTYIFYCADLFRDVMQKLFRATDEKMILMGNPRNDLLFRPKKLENQSGNKTVIWMPTFRHGIGMKETEKSIPVIDDSNIKNLDEHLIKLGIDLYIKPHPLQIDCLDNINKSNKLNNITLITDDALRKSGVSLYEFLGSTNALLTDYSSVYFDYMLLDRPIGFAIDDMMEYMANRGFSIDDPQRYMPGKMIYTFDDLIAFFHDVAEDKDEYRTERNKICQIVNVYKDSDNRKRCAELFINSI